MTFFPPPFFHFGGFRLWTGFWLSLGGTTNHLETPLGFLNPLFQLAHRGYWGFLFLGIFNLFSFFGPRPLGPLEIFFPSLFLVAPKYFPAFLGPFLGTQPFGHLWAHTGGFSPKKFFPVVGGTLYHPPWATFRGENASLGGAQIGALSGNRRPRASSVQPLF